MATRELHIGQASVMIDEDTGALLVKVSGNITADIIDADLAPIGAVGDAAAEGDAASGTLIARVRGLCKAVGSAASGLLKSIADAVAAIPAKGQALAAASMPVVLTTEQGQAAGAPVTSGTTALATTTNDAVQAIAANATQTFYRVMAINEGSVAGFISLDAGTTWIRLPALSSVTMDGVLISNKAIQIKRIAGGSDLSGVYVAAW